MVATKIQSIQKLYVETDMRDPDLFEWAHGMVASICRRCPGRIEPNDDSAAVLQLDSGAVVLIVGDGVGGSPFGHKASAIAVQAVVERVKQTNPEDDLRSSIVDGIEHANHEILDLGVGAATTLSVVEIRGRVARAYQVGDSMTLVIGQRGALKWKSTSHSPVGYAVESGMLDESDAMTHDERHIVSNLVGSRMMHIEIGPAQPLAPRDTIIVGTDGLFDNVHLDEVIQHGRAGKPFERLVKLTSLAAARMTDESHSRIGKPDDLTILMYTPQFRSGRSHAQKSQSGLTARAEQLN